MTQKSNNVVNSLGCEYMQEVYISVQSLFCATKKKSLVQTKRKRNPLENSLASKNRLHQSGKIIKIMKIMKEWKNERMKETWQASSTTKRTNKKWITRVQHTCKKTKINIRIRVRVINMYRETMNFCNSPLA